MVSKIKNRKKTHRSKIKRLSFPFGKWLLIKIEKSVLVILCALYGLRLYAQLPYIRLNPRCTIKQKEVRVLQSRSVTIFTKWAHEQSDAIQILMHRELHYKQFSDLQYWDISITHLLSRKPVLSLALIAP